MSFFGGGKISGSQGAPSLTQTNSHDCIRGWRKLVSQNIFITPLKFNMEPENGPLEKEIPFGNHHFQVPC